MDEITQKVVDGTAWREFCDLLARRRRVDPGRGQPRRPARPGRGVPHAHPAAAGRARVPPRARASRPTPSSSAPATRRSRSSARTRTTTTSARRSTGGTTTGSGARGARRSGSASTSSPAPGSAAAGPGTGATLHEEQMHIEPDGSFEVIISQREHPGNWLRSEADTRSIAIRQTFLDKRGQQPRRSPDRAHRRRGLDRRTPHPRRPRPRAGHRGPLREDRRRHRRPVGGPPVAVAQRVHRRGRGRPHRQVQGPADQVAPGLLRSRRRRGARRRGHAAGLRVLDDRPPQPLDGDARLRQPPGHPQLPLRAARARRQRPLRRRPAAIPACPTGSTPPATDEARSACGGSGPTSSTCCPPPGSCASTSCAPERGPRGLHHGSRLGWHPAALAACTPREYAWSERTVPHRPRQPA